MIENQIPHAATATPVAMTTFPLFNSTLKSYITISANIPQTSDPADLLAAACFRIRLVELDQILDVLFATEEDRASLVYRGGEDIEDSFRARGSHTASLQVALISSMSKRSQRTCSQR